MTKPKIISLESQGFRFIDAAFVEHKMPKTTSRYSPYSLKIQKDAIAATKQTTAITIENALLRYREQTISPM